MSYAVIILRKAQEDILRAQSWYRNESPGLEDELGEVLYQTFLKIAQHPTRYMQVGKEARRALIKRFPYRVYFYINESIQRIEIIAVVHNSRHPRVWKKRL